VRAPRNQGLVRGRVRPSRAPMRSRRGSRRAPESDDRSGDVRETQRATEACCAPGSPPHERTRGRLFQRTSDFPSRRAPRTNFLLRRSRRFYGASLEYRITRARRGADAPPRRRATCRRVQLIGIRARAKLVPRPGAGTRHAASGGPELQRLARAGADGSVSGSGLPCSADSSRRQTVPTPC